MIGYLRGILLDKQPAGLLVDVQGLGYEVQVSLTTLFELPAPGEAVSLYTHFVVREDAQLLYGFGTTDERQLFRELIKISGVGPKLALAILSGMSTTDFVRCVQTDDVATLVRLPGVGKKTAERLLVEMRDRLAGWAVHPATKTIATGAAGLAARVQEAESALVALGYRPQDAARMINVALPGGDEVPNVEQLIRTALKTTVNP
ncbi:MAG: Holliday junction branch migration protein RuvA [Porticoccaceae bacterium]